MTDTLYSRQEATDRLLQRMVELGEVTAAAALVGTRDRIELLSFAGEVVPGCGTPPHQSSLFDLASLTKPWMATLALRLDEAGLLSLQQTLVEIWPQIDSRMRQLPLAALLRHCAGLQPWAPLYHLTRDRAAVERLLLEGSLMSGEIGVYGDLGFILWGLAAERALGRPLIDLVSEVLVPLAVPGRLTVTPGAHQEVVSCGLDGFREAELAKSLGFEITLSPPPERGVAQDGNARFLGGLAGHAGLFGDLLAQWALGRMWLGAGGLAPSSIHRAFADPGPYALGWATGKALLGSGPRLGRDGFGHIGFTGGGLWVDPAANAILVLLAHRTSTRVDLDPWRRRFHQCALGSAGREEQGPW